MARPDAPRPDAFRRRFELNSSLDRQIRGLLHASQVPIDALMLSFGFMAGYLMRAWLPLPAVPVNPPPFSQYVPMMIVHVLAVMVVFYMMRMYHQRRAVSRIDEAYAVAQNASIGTFMAVAIETLTFKNSGFDLDYPRGVIIYAWLLGIALVIAGRELHRQVTVRLRDLGVGRDNVLVIGSSDVSRRIIEQVTWASHLGYNMVGVVNGKPGSTVAGVPIIGSTGQIPEIIDQYEVDEVIIALPDASHRELVELVSMCQRGRVNIKVYPDIFAYMTSGITVDDLNGMPMLSVRDVALRGWKLSLKRGMDFIGSFFGLVMFSPFMTLTALLIKLESPGPAFFCQDRMGLDGHSFPMIKFRSMRQDAEKSGPGWTTEGDPRVTRMGRFMRKTNWDEIPQLINVLLGQMSMVGPRPEQPYYVQQFRDSIPRYMERHREKAGMTGWAQVNGLRGDTSILERTKYDLWYVENWSLWLDIKIVLRTMFQMIFGRSKNAY